MVPIHKLGCQELTFLVLVKSRSIPKPVGIAAQAEQVMENLKQVLLAAKMSFNDVLKTTVFITNMDNFAAVNEVYGRYFTDKMPARSCVAVAGLPKGVLVEIELIACSHNK